MDDATGVVAYVEHHRTLGDWVGLLAAAGFRLTTLLEPEWPSDHDRLWGGWSAVRGRVTPGTAIFGADLLLRPGLTRVARVDDGEIAKSAALEQRHWWYAERRAMVRRTGRSQWPAGTRPRRRLRGRRQHGGAARPRLVGDRAGVLLRRRRDRRLPRPGRRPRRRHARCPSADATFDLVMSTDVWEHIEDDGAVARETARVLRPGGRALVAVPCSMKLWSGHDVALGHVRRYEREQLVALVDRRRARGRRRVVVERSAAAGRPGATPASESRAESEMEPCTRC